MLSVVNNSPKCSDVRSLLVEAVINILMKILKREITVNICIWMRKHSLEVANV